MPQPTEHQRFPGTRDRLVGLLRCGSRTVDELAAEIGLTDNAVRAHLATLERDGLVRQAGVRRTPGVGKPPVLFELRPEADAALSHAYAPVLVALLQELVPRLGAEDSATLLAAVGRRLADSLRPVTGAGHRERVLAGVAVLNALGGAAELEDGDVQVIRGCGCPLGAAVAARPETCHAIEALLSDIVGSQVRQRCQRGDRPSCRFEVDPAA